MKAYFISLAIILCASQAIAQTVHHFEKGLVVSSGTRYGREAIYTDELAWQLYQGSLKTPVNGQEFGVNAKGDKLLWREIKADSSGRFRFFPRRENTGVPNPFLNPGAVDRGADYLYLTYQSPKAQSALIHVQGNSGMYFNGVPHMGDPYSSGYLFIPVLLKKGVNELHIRGANILPEIIFPEKPVFISVADSTFPHIVPGIQIEKQYGAIVIMNTTLKPLINYKVVSTLNGHTSSENIPTIPALSSRKVKVSFDATGITSKGSYDCSFTLMNGSKSIDTRNIPMNAVNSTDQYSSTFVSDIDGSLQYYAVTPDTRGAVRNAALFLSVHGAGVEAIGQARAYQSKDWGTLVAATNRRPRGFNWEDWGRLDALEVLGIAKARFAPDPQKIYLTGHSMGGHGTWFLGATYPDYWAAIAPCAGYPSLKDYGSADGRIPDSSKNRAEQLLLRAGNQSDVPQLASNYKALGVYILHGDSDRVVPVRYARQMRQQLSGFHKDFSYYEYPGGEHWFGNQSVDWKPLFDYFKWHTRLADSAVNQIDFMTSSPGISSNYRWATIIQQTHPLEYSRIQLDRNRKSNTITGVTQNVLLLKFDLSEFKIGTNLTIKIDNSTLISYKIVSDNDSLYLKKENSIWAITQKPNAREKNPIRYGTFKEAFNHRVVLVYGTKGKKEENEVNIAKAMYDAESWYYRGNGAMDVVSDKQFIAGNYAGRNVVLYGNSVTNAAWNQLLDDCPIRITRGSIEANGQQWKGDDLGAYFVWPQKDPALTTGVVSGTGVKGMKAAYANQYFAGGSGFPDFMIFSAELMRGKPDAIKLAGFFNNQWTFSSDDYLIQP